MYNRSKLLSEKFHFIVDEVFNERHVLLNEMKHKVSSTNKIQGNTNNLNTNYHVEGGENTN